MSNVFNLLKLQIDNKTNLLKTFAPKKMAISILKAVLILALGLIGVWFVGSRIFVLGVAINAELISIILAVTQLISVIFCVGNVIGTLYLSKDNEMLMCLPVTPNELFVSKILFIYLKELFVGAMISIPVFTGLGIMGGYGAEYFCSFFIILFFLPILPIVLASLLSVLVMAVIKFLKRYTYLSVIVMLLFVVACFAGYMFLVSNIVKTFNIADKQIETVNTINADVVRIGGGIPIYNKLALAFLSFKNWLYVLIFIGVCLALTVVTLILIRSFYFKTSAVERQDKTRETKGVYALKSKSAFLSLMQKEAICVFRSPAQVFEYFLFTLLMPFIVFTYDKLFTAITVNQAGVNMIAGSHIMAVAILAMLSNLASASAISREGANFYISKIVPVDYFTQVFAKLTFNAIFTVGALILTMIVSCFYYPVWQVVIGTAAVAFFAIGHAAMSLDMDINNPTISFEGNGDASAVSKSTTKSIISALIIGIAIGLFIILTSQVKNAVIPYIIILALGLAFMIRRLILLILRINLKYDKIEM